MFTQHNTYLTNIHSFYFEHFNVIYNYYHKKSLMHLAEKTQLPVYTSKFHQHNTTDTYNLPTGSAHKYNIVCTPVLTRLDFTQVADDSSGKAIAVCLGFNMFTAMVATSDCL